jgi:hypothetical protein
VLINFDQYAPIARKRLARAQRYCHFIGTMKHPDPHGKLRVRNGPTIAARYSLEKARLLTRYVWKTTLTQENSTMTVNAKEAIILTFGAASLAVIVGAASILISQPAAATPEFAAQTGKACGVCHVNPGGGGPLTEFGEKFKANGNKLPK